MKRDRLRYVAIPFLLAIAGGFCAIGFWTQQLQQGVEASIQNTGLSTMHSVVIRVTGASRQLGELAPGASAAARISPTGESDVLIEFSDSSGHVQQLTADCYLEPSYHGTVHLLIQDGAIVGVQRDISLW